MPSSLGNDECVASQDDRYVMVPASEASTFEVIEAELTLEVLVGAFGSPSLFDVPDELFSRHVFRAGDEIEFGRLFLAVLPLHQEPQDVSLSSRNALVCNGQDSPRGKSCR